MAKTALIKRITNYELRITAWIKENKVEAIILLLILLSGAFFRLYRISEYMTFLGDEGRDAIVVRRLLVNLDPILIGPGTSIGNMYLGPIYYYMMAPSLFLANFSPVGPAIMIALLGVATIFFVWFIARQWFPPLHASSTEAAAKAEQGFVGQASIAGLIAAGLYAISPTVINYSRSSWNPNIMPFFSLLTIYSIWQFWTKKKFGWIVVAGISFAVVLQSHYLGLLLAPVVGFFWLLTLTGLKRSKVKGQRSKVRYFFKNSLISLSVFLLFMSPLVIFDARHGWRNFSAIHRFFAQRQTTVSARPWTAIPKVWPTTEQISTRLLAGTDESVGRLLATIIIFLLLLAFIKRRRLAKLEKKAYFLLLIWLGFALLGLGVYKQHIYDHYFGFFFAAPFLLVAGLSQLIVRYKQVVGSGVVFVTLFYLVFVNLQNNPLKYPPNRQLQKTQEVAQKMIKESNDEKFNIAVIAERNYEGAYQYFLERWNAPFIIIDPQRYEETVTEQLFVVCELSADKCDPVNHPKAEIANFGWKKIDEQWELAGIVLFKLIHTQ